MILILGGLEDEHACHMLDWLRRRGADAELLDAGLFPAGVEIAYGPAADAGHVRLPSGRRIDFAEVAAVYWRCYNPVAPPELADPEQAYVAANDSRSLVETLMLRLRCRWVNGWHAYQSHQTKPAQLAAVARLGAPVPATLIANDAEAVRDFAVRHPRCIFKPVQGGAHTLRLTPEHLTDDALRRLEYAPVTIQEEIPGGNIRVFVAGERVLACEVAGGEVDFRDDPDPAVTPHELPDEVTAMCLRAARELELLWTGIDLRRTPEGRYVFLEANPSPMFLGFESRSGLPLTEALAALLLPPHLS